MRLMLVSLCLCLTSVSMADGWVKAGYQEAVFSVSSADAWVAMMEDVAGWAVLHEGELDAALIDAWGLPVSASARSVLIGNPGTTRGYIRLLEFDGVEQQQMRGNANVWDTGGWFDVNFRATDIDQTHQQLTALDWQATSPPVEFSFGPFIVREWITRGPDGIVFAVIERIEPALEGWPQLRQMSRIFNATQVVADIDAARDFYRNVLGFESYLEHRAASEAPGPNVLGLPHNLATEIVRDISIVHPSGINEGSVELLHFEGLTGEDFSANAKPPNLGVLSLRFPVTDMQAFHAHAIEEGLEIVVPPTAVTVPPYGVWTMMAIRGPEGAWLEFYEEHPVGEGK